MSCCKKLGEAIELIVEELEELSSLIGAPKEFVASEDIQAFQVITSDGYNANTSIPGTRNKAIGLALAFTAIATAGTYQKDGQITNLAWNWNSGDILFLNLDTLSITSVNTGYTQIIGTAINSNTIEINIHQAIIL